MQFIVKIGLLSPVWKVERMNDNDALEQIRGQGHDRRMEVHSAENYHSPFHKIKIRTKIR